MNKYRLFIRCVMLALLVVLSQWSKAASAAEITLRVNDASGNAVSGADAAIVPAGRTVYVTDGLTLDEDPAYVLGRSDAQGKVTLRTDVEDFLVIVVHETGYALLDRELALQGGGVQLTCWGRVEGRMMIGATPAADEPVGMWVSSDGPSMPGTAVPGWRFQSDIKTDPEGRFQFERVPAERVSIAPKRRYWDVMTYPAPRVRVDVKPKETSQVTIGGKGRPVMGKIDLPQSVTDVDGWQFVYCTISPQTPAVPSPVPDAVRTKPLREQASWWESFRGSEGERASRAARKERQEAVWERTHPIEVARDGSFRIEDVAPGKYVLTIGAMVPYREDRPGKDLGTTSAEVTIEAFEGERTDTPQVLPRIEWEVAEAVKVEVGDDAPEFSVPAFDGSTLKLSDFHGKFVVLDFWATWCGPCVEEMPNLIEAHRRFSPTGKVEFISLSLDSEPDAPIAFIEREKLDWHHGYLGEWDQDKVTRSYGVGGIPSLWLIAPDGKVVAKGLRGDELLREVETALAGDEP